MKYTSKQVAIHQADSTIYHVLSDFENFTPILADRVEGWQATTDSCTFKAKGFTLRLRMEERTPSSVIKIVAEDNGSPIPFTFWVQLKGIDPEDTRLRLVLDVELNMMMKMMVGSKLQGALDTIVDQIAEAFNNPHHDFAHLTHKTTA